MHNGFDGVDVIGGVHPTPAQFSYGQWDQDQLRVGDLFLVVFRNRVFEGAVFHGCKFHSYWSNILMNLFLMFSCHLNVRSIQ